MDKNLPAKLRARLSRFIDKGGSYNALAHATNVPFSTIRMFHQFPERDVRFQTLLAIDAALKSVNE